MQESSSSPKPALSGRLRWLVSETLVIVLGVLIALAVDRAVQSADEQRFEAAQLRGLASDFEEAATVAASAASATASSKATFPVLQLALHWVIELERIESLTVPER